ncbi:hypothetical protein BDQ12DRAFT_656566 [Crucibulum laeve]|uniref:Pyridoxamine 5'-phosphate oxidase N-terminal domain-containing protein n=1 Tax=Crucibulum laeve TaxID=68775 RepID=A0A5C3LPX4_9AGAR|nr:hypothetical protein BDQ12DRAFT_656566 [Crucibulum laeve]
MGQFFDAIPEFLFPWIKQQKMFWVATAPLGTDGHVNVSPKGFEGTFRIVNEKQVWYEDLTGSGVETISHLKENGRITIMFNAFEGPPRICRLFGTGTVYEFGTPEYDVLLPAESRQPGSRSVIMVDVHKVGTSCGYSIPFFTFKSNRFKLHNFATKREKADIEAEASCTPSELAEQPRRTDQGLKAYWNLRNLKSIDGLTGIEHAHESTAGFKRDSTEGNWKDDERVSVKHGKNIFGGLDRQLVVGLVLGVVITTVYRRLVQLYL